MALLETVRVAVTKLEDQIEPYASGIMSILPALWAESGEEHLMKQAILTMITAIINSLRHKGRGFHQPVYALITDAVRPDSEASVYLLEEALELWSALLAQTPSEDPPPELLAMVSSLLPLLELGSEHLRQCFEILESYIVLSPRTVLEPAVFLPLLTSQRSMLPLLNSSRARDASMSPHVLQTLLQTLSVPGYYDEQTRASVLEHILNQMIQTGYLSSLMSALHEAYIYHEDPRPNRRPPDIIGVGETSLFTLLSQLVLADSSAFLAALKTLPNPDTSADTLTWLLTEWFQQYDSTPDTLRRKTQLLAITSLLGIVPPPEHMLSSLQSIFTICTDTMTELAEGAAAENRGDYLYSSSQPGEMLPNWPESDSAEDVRKRHMTNWDVVYVINTRDFVLQKFQTAMRSCGGQEAFVQQWITDRVDQEVVKGFASLELL